MTRPTEHAEQEGTCSHCGAEVSPWPNREHRCLLSDLRKPQHAPSGEQSENSGQLPGKTYHLGHVPGTVIVDKVELDALRADLAQRTAELDLCFKQRDQYLAELQRLRVVNQEYADLANTEQVHAANLAEQWQQAQAELQQTRAVVEREGKRLVEAERLLKAYQGLADGRGVMLDRIVAAYEVLDEAGALDHSPAVGETQES